MKRVWTFILDTAYDLFGIFTMLIVLALMVAILYWRLSILFGGSF